MARNTPKVINGSLETGDVHLDTPGWFAWLEQAASFCYVTAFNSFTLHRRERSGSEYWYAYRRKNGRLKTLYAGKTADLNRARLDELALQFEGKPVSDQEDYLDTKFFLPPGPAGLVSRQRLLEKLDQGNRAKLIMVIAPPGYGKTTLLSEWSKTGKKQVAWISLDETDNDLARFTDYLAAALEPFAPYMAKARVDRLNLSSIEIVLAAVLEAANRLTTDTYLVLDDFHFIEAGRIIEEVNSALARIPPRLHLVISSRTVPAISLGRLRAKNQVLELKTEDLCFTAEEVQDFFDSTLPSNLSREQVYQLWERCEGWATGIQLAALSLQGRDGSRIKEFIRTFSGSQRYVLEYLGEEVLNGQTAEMRRFLLGTSILSRLHAGLCEFVTGLEGGQEKLEQLEKANLFIVPLDEEREWYRYHHLFAQFLQTRLQQSGGNPDKFELHARAAVWYEQHNMVNDAIQHFFAAGNFEQAACLVETGGRKLLVRGEITTLKRWLETLPDAIIRSKIELSVLYIWVLALSGDLAEAELWYKQHLESIAPGKAQTLHLVLILQKGDLEGIQYIDELVLDNLEDPDPFIRSVQALVIGLTQDFFGNSAEANRAYLTSSLFGQAAGNILLVQVATAQVGDILYLKGQLHRSAETYRRALDPFPQDENGGDGLRATSLVYQGYSLVLYEWNELDEAARLLEEAVKLNSTFAYHLVLSSILAQLALVKAAQGEHQEAQMLILQAREAAHRVCPSWLNWYTELILVRINLKQGNLAEVHTWLKTYPSELGRAGEMTPILIYINEMRQALLTKLSLKEGKIPEALESLEQLEVEAEQRDWFRWIMENKALRAAVLCASGKEKAAVALLAEALAAGEKEGFIRIFADHSDILGDLLEKASEHLDPLYRRKLLEACGITGLPASRGASLSEREREVLKLVAAGKSNEEIARELMVGLSTVKTHLLHIYAKLEVRNRSQAAARARELGVI